MSEDVCDAVFDVGHEAEKRAEAYASEADQLAAFQAGFQLVISALEGYRHSVSTEMAAAKVPTRDIELVRSGVTQCVGIVKKLHDDAESKRLHAQGAADGISTVVNDIRARYDRLRSEDTSQDT